MENGNKKEKVITRMAAYDWLKVMGTLMVVIGHYYAMFPNGSQLPLWSSGTFQTLAANGGYAIIFFFAVSEYMLMKHYYDRSGEESFSRYITPKIQRLWPLHFSTMLFCFILQQIRVANGLDFYVYQANSITDVIVGTFFGGHFVTPELSLNGPAWTMSVTFFCYIIFWIIMKYDNIINHNIVFVAAAIFNSYDLYMVLSGRGSGFPYIIDSMQYSAAFFVGCLVFEVSRLADNDIHLRKRLNKISMVVIAFFVAVFVCPAQLILFGADGYTFLGIYIIVPLMLWWFRGDRINHLLNKIPLRPGKLYFPIYLLHFPMMLLIETLNQMEVIHVNYASMKVFGIYMIVLLICAKLVAMGSDKVRVWR